MVLGLLLGIITIGIAFAIYVHTKKIYNIATVYTGFWGVLLFLPSLSLYGIRPVSVDTYRIVFFGVLIFVMGWALGYSIPVFKIRYEGSHVLSRKKNKKDFIYVFLIVDFVFYFFNSMNTFDRILDGYSYTYIRNMHQGYVADVMWGNQFIFLFNSVFAAPMLRAMMIVVVVYTFSETVDYKLIGLTLIDIFLHGFSTASRFNYFDLFIILIIAYFKYNSTISDRTKKLVKRIMVFMIAALIIVTEFRGVDVGTSVNHSLFKSIYIYFASPVPLFDYWKTALDYSKTRMHGVIFFGGFLDLFDSICKYLLGIELHILDEMDVFVKDAEKFIRIYEKNSINAFVSSFCYFYADFGVWGVMLGSIIHGGISGMIEKMSVAKGGLRRDSLFLLFVLFAVQTFIRWPFASLSNCMVAIYIFLLSKQNNRSTFS